MRKTPLANGEYYHIFNRSIAKFEIFNDAEDYHRMLQLLDLCRYPDFQYKYSQFILLDLRHQKAIINSIRNSKNMIVQLCAYCLMPTHPHSLLKQEVDGGIAKYMQKVLNSYSKYFNIKHKRKGPLWEGHFKNVLVANNEQMMHLTWYIHLNPTSAGLVKKPEQWNYSSYHEYINQDKREVRNNLCQFQDLMNINPKEYKKQVNDRVLCQKEISKIKHLLID